MLIHAESSDEDDDDKVHEENLELDEFFYESSIKLNIRQLREHNQQMGSMRFKSSFDEDYFHIPARKLSEE